MLQQNAVRDRASEEDTSLRRDSGTGSATATTLRRVSIDEIRPGNSPRFDGEDEEHVMLLASKNGPLPPILVHGETMHVIDGMHRLRAARLRGETVIDVQVFEGDEHEAFVEAVRSNVSHGKPLTLAEREAAAVKVLASHQQWSDRIIADACGLSAKTVAAIRRRVSSGAPDPGVRLGRDGKLRPVDAGDARERAADMLIYNPDASLREIARVAGVSPATVRDVRDRVRRGIGPRTKPVTSDPDRRPTVSRDEVLSDASLRAADACAQFVDWLYARLVTREDWEPFVAEVPISRVYVLADLARNCAGEWRELADALERRSRSR